MIKSVGVARSVQAYRLSETGPVRRINESCFISAEDLRLFVVADGMGGHAAGEVAARVGVEAIEGFIRRSQETTDFSWPYGIEPTLSYDANRLRLRWASRTGESTVSPRTTTTISGWGRRLCVRCCLAAN